MKIATFVFVCFLAWQSLAHKDGKKCSIYIHLISPSFCHFKLQLISASLAEVMPQRPNRHTSAHYKRMATYISVDVPFSPINGL